VKFFYYAGTMQETCLRLMGKKLLVSLAMEGKFATDGLQAIDEGDDILMAMARELVTEKGIGESAGATHYGDSRPPGKDRRPRGRDHVRGGFLGNAYLGGPRCTRCGPA
jgi:hypothetical protein